MPEIKKKHEQHRDNAVSKLEILSSKIDVVIDALDFVVQWYDEDKVMYAYMRDVLQDTKLNRKAILANVEKLAEMADSNIPDDLPF